MAVIGKFQCGSCEQFFDESKDGHCPFCGSGNYVRGCIDESDVVNELRQFSQKVKNEVVLLPQCTFKEAVNNESDNGKPFVPVNVGELLYFIADMME